MLANYLKEDRFALNMYSYIQYYILTRLQPLYHYL